MNPEIIIAITFIILIALIMLRFPIFASLGIAGVVGIFLSQGMIGLTQVPLSIMSQLNNFTLVAVPLFILMGEILFVTGMGKDLYQAANKWLNRIPGGLAIASIFAAAVFGAMCGVSIVGVAVIGVMAIPEMLRYNYNRSLAAGAISASGGLAMLIPPSLLFILYGSVSQVSVAKLFIGGIIPGVFLAILMAAYVIIKVIRNPELAPRPAEKVTWQERFSSLKRLWTALALIASVLVTIYTGVCTATESAAIGAFGALIIAAFVYKTISLQNLKKIFSATARTTAAVAIIAACAFVFGQFLLYTRVPDIVSQFCIGLELSPILIIIGIMVIFVFLGMFIDGGSLVLVTTPILLPTIIALGFDPLWWGILLVMNMNMAVITPPVGLNLYALKSVVPDLSIEEIIQGSLPYVVIEFLALMPFIFFPGLLLWLPGMMK